MIRDFDQFGEQSCSDSRCEIWPFLAALMSALGSGGGAAAAGAGSAAAGAGAATAAGAGATAAGAASAAAPMLSGLTITAAPAAGGAGALGAGAAAGAGAGLLSMKGPAANGATAPQNMQATPAVNQGPGGLFGNMRNQFSQYTTKEGDLDWRRMMDTAQQMQGGGGREQQQAQPMPQMSPQSSEAELTAMLANQNAQLAQMRAGMFGRRRYGG